MKNHFIVPPGLFTRQHKQRSQFHLFMEVRIALGLFAPLLFFDIFLQSSPSNFREFCRKLSNKSAVFYNKPAFPSSYTGKSKKIFPGLHQTWELMYLEKFFAALDTGLLPCHRPGFAGTPLPSRTSVSFPPSPAASPSLSRHSLQCDIFVPLSIFFLTFTAAKIKYKPQTSL